MMLDNNLYYSHKNSIFWSNNQVQLLRVSHMITEELPIVMFSNLANKNSFLLQN